MAQTVIRSRQLENDGIWREDLNISTSGKAVIRRAVAGTGITLSSTGADAGTGDVTINIGQSVATNATPTFAGMNLTSHLTFDNAKDIRWKDTGGFAIQIFNVGSDGQLLIRSAVGAGSTDKGIKFDTATDGNIKFFMTSQGKFGIGVNPSGLQWLTMTNGQDFGLHNITPDSTNYERLRLLWNANVATIGVESGGTGSQRSLQLRAEGSSGNFVTLTLKFSGAPYIEVTHPGVSTATDWYSWTGTSTSGSGTTKIFKITPSYNQAGTASNLDFVVDRTETNIGSGLQRLASLRVNGNEYFGVDNSGIIYSRAGASWRPLSDSTTAINIAQNNGTAIVTIDTTNSRLGVGTTPFAKTHFHHSTIGGEITRWSSATSVPEIGNPIMSNYQGTKRTTSNTTVDLVTIATTTNSIITVLAFVDAGKSVFSQYTAGHGKIMAGSFKNNNGTVTQIGTTTSLHDKDDITTGTVDFVISGTNIIVRGTGVASTTINWICNAIVTKNILIPL
jgi:hypothetical protein